MGLIHCLTFESVSLLLSGAVFSSATQQEQLWEHKGCPDDDEDDYGRELQASWVCGARDATGPARQVTVSGSALGSPGPDGVRASPKPLWF